MWDVAGLVVLAIAAVGARSVALAGFGFPTPGTPLAGAAGSRAIVGVTR